jgi:hypothetical protein
VGWGRPGHPVTPRVPRRRRPAPVQCPPQVRGVLRPAPARYPRRRRLPAPTRPGAGTLARPHPHPPLPARRCARPPTRLPARPRCRTLARPHTPARTPGPAHPHVLRAGAPGPAHQPTRTPLPVCRPARRRVPGCAPLPTPERPHPGTRAYGPPLVPPCRRRPAHQPEHPRTPARPAVPARHAGVTRGRTPGPAPVRPAAHTPGRTHARPAGRGDTRAGQHTAARGCAPPPAPLRSPQTWAGPAPSGGGRALGTHGYSPGRIPRDHHPDRQPQGRRR